MERDRELMLAQAGVDLPGLTARMMGSQEMAFRFLLKFPDDPNFAALESALSAQDWPAALTASHTLKGVCANLSMPELTALLEKQVSALRQGDHSGAAALQPEIGRAYRQVVQAVRRCLEA